MRHLKRSMKNANSYKFLLFALLILVSRVSGQILVEKEIPFLSLTSKSSASIDRVYNNEDRVVLSLVLSEKFNEAKRSVDRDIQIKTSDGDLFNMEKNQNPIGFYKNNLYSYTSDFENQQNVYSVQSMENGLSAKQKTISLSFSSTARVLDSGDIIFTEGGHSGRDWAALYSKDLEELHSFRPFNDESSITYTASKDYIVYAGQIKTDSVVRIGLYDAAMFKKMVSIEQVSIDPDHLVSSVSLGENNIVVLLMNIITGNNQILILDKEFNVVNKINFPERIAHNKIISLNGKMFFSTPQNVHCLDVATGVKDWSYKRDNTNAIKTEKGYQFYGGELFFLDDAHLLFLEGQYEDGRQEVKDTSLKVIKCETGEILQGNQLGDFSDGVNLKRDRNTISIFSKNKIRVYEKK